MELIYDNGHRCVFYRYNRLRLHSFTENTTHFMHLSLWIDLNVIFGCCCCISLLFDSLVFRNEPTVFEVKHRNNYFQSCLHWEHNSDHNSHPKRTIIGIDLFIHNLVFFLFLVFPIYGIIVTATILLSLLPSSVLFGSGAVAGVIDIFCWPAIQ